MLPSLFEALIVILDPGSRLESENEGVGEEKLATRKPFSFVASKWKV